MGPVATAKLMAAPKEPVPLPCRTDTLLLFRFATARSCLLSPSKSPIATEQGPLPTATNGGRAPTAKLVGAPKEPVPLPSRMDTLLLPLLATARSCLPSLLKSPSAREAGLPPAPKLVGAPKVPVPVPSRMDTLLVL